MAGDVALSQALSYARDLKSAYDTARAREQELVVANEFVVDAQAKRFARRIEGRGEQQPGGRSGPDSEGQ